MGRTNKAAISGKIITEPTKSPDADNIYIMTVNVKRTSNNSDDIPVKIEEKNFNPEICKKGRYVSLTGEFQSKSRKLEDRTKLELYFFARYAELIGKDDKLANLNSIELYGIVYKPPVIRQTPMGRDIADLFLKVERPNGYRDSIPCIVWESTIKEVERLEVGDMIKIKGRIQSRKYIKILEDETSEERTAYEISVNRIWLQE